MENRITFLGNYSKELLSSGFDLKEMIANHAWRLEWSRGYILHKKDREVIADILERCHFETMGPEVTKTKAKRGYCILVFGRTLDKTLHLRIPALWGTSNVAKVFEKEQLAVTWERIVFDHSNYIMKITYDTKKTEITFYQEAADGVLGDVVVLGESRKIANFLNVPLVDYHNWGIVPVKILKNLPHKNFFGDPLQEQYSDDTASGDALNKLQEHVYQILEAIEWELKYNITFIVANLTPAAQEKIRQGKELFTKAWNRIVVTNNSLGVNSLPGSWDKGGNPFTVTQGKPLLDTYANYLNYTIDRAYNICGYNSPQGTREHGTNKTSSEVSINMQNDMLTTASKIRIETAQYNRLFKDLLLASGYPDGECEIEILGMSTMEASVFEERIIARFQAGLISRARAISRLDNVSMEEAEERAKEIEAEEKVKAEQENKNNGGVNNNAKI